MRNPKQTAALQKLQHYQYYAGYSQGFVEDAFRALALEPGQTVLDPWNGAGTTTASAHLAGLRGIGFDVNPVTVLIAKSRLLRPDVAESLRPLAMKIVEMSSRDSGPLDPADALLMWFGRGTSRSVRNIERSINRLLVNPEAGSSYPIADRTMPHSSLAAFLYLALFDVVRSLVKQYTSSNPTWIKSAAGRRVGIPAGNLGGLFLDSVARATERLVGPADLQIDLFASEARNANDEWEFGPRLQLASSTRLPLADASVDAVVTSPPYCTRLDYVKATLPELAVFGYTQSDMRELRDRMIGTPTVTQQPKNDDTSSLGQAVNQVLGRVSSHPSYASSTYYRKYYVQYFASMRESLIELKRVLKPSRSAVLVVQDSYYKEVRVDLPGLIGEMSLGVGWKSWSRTDFPVSRNMATIHPGSKNYRTRSNATESVLILHS